MLYIDDVHSRNYQSVAFVEIALIVFSFSVFVFFVNFKVKVQS